MPRHRARPEADRAHQQGRDAFARNRERVPPKTNPEHRRYWLAGYDAASDEAHAAEQFNQRKQA